MLCPNCNAEVREGAAFCGNCGAVLPATPPAETPASAAPGVAPTTPLPPAQPPAYAPVPPPPVGPGAGWPPPGAPAGPPAKKKTGLIAAAIIAAVLLLGGVTAGVVYLVQSNAEEEDDRDRDRDDEDQDEDEDADEDADDDEHAEPVGFESADAAVLDYLVSADAGEWVCVVYDEIDDSIVYWAGPPNSEFVEQITVEQQDDGSWLVTSTDAVPGYGGDVSFPEDEAASVVYEFMYAVQENRGDDAHALTVDPFASDPASAQMGSGDFISFGVERLTPQSDGSFWVQTYQEWTWGDEYWEYWVVPTETGYRIADMRPY